MIVALRVLFAGILLSMLAVTTAASCDRGVIEAAGRLWPDPWFRATLADAYFGFLVVYLWVAYKERSLASRAGWAVGFALLGNIAIAVYMLRELGRLRPGDPLERLLLRDGRA